MSKEPERHEKSAKAPETPQKHHSETPKASKASKSAVEEKFYEPSEDEVFAVEYCQWRGSPSYIDYLDVQGDNSGSAGHQYYEIRFTLFAADIPVDPNAPPVDPLNPPPPPKDRVYQIASVTLRANPQRAVDGMENAGMILHPTPLEIDEAAKAAKRKIAAAAEARKAEEVPEPHPEPKAQKR